MTVIYKIIEGHPRYRVGTDGTVQRFCKGQKGSRNRQPKWKTLKGSIPTGGYLRIDLAFMGSGQNRVVRAIHHLVLEAFVGPCPDGMEACHNDGNQKNNALENLRWDTHASNIADMMKHGTWKRGEQVKHAKLTKMAILEAIELRKVPGRGRLSHWTWTRLGAKYGVSSETIRLAVTGKQWSHVHKI
jgi:HNH endonuclease